MARRTETETRLSDLLPASDDVHDIEFVPHRNGLMRADKHVIVSFRITAKERYRWSLVAAKRGLTMVDVARRAFNTLIEEDELDREDAPDGK